MQKKGKSFVLSSRQIEISFVMLRQSQSP